MSLAILTHENAVIHVKVRGELVGVVPDPAGELSMHLCKRYSYSRPADPPDRADRAILVMSIDRGTTRTLRTTTWQI